MSIKEIISCYVSASVPKPSNMERLRESFVKSGYKEKVIAHNKLLYKRGAPIAPEFNYNSEALEVRVILEATESELKISVGNWGFPFEPLMMKGRFKRNLTSIVEQIQSEGALTVNTDVVEKIKEESKQNIKSAILVFLAAAIALLSQLIYAIFKNT